MHARESPSLLFSLPPSGENHKALQQQQRLTCCRSKQTAFVASVVVVVIFVVVGIRQVSFTLWQRQQPRGSVVKETKKTCRLLIYIIQLHRKRGDRREVQREGRERSGWVNKEKCT